MARRKADAVEVVPGLWIGSAPSQRQAQHLHSLGIDAVVDLRAERDPLGTTRWPDGVMVRYAELEDHGAPSADELRAAAAIVSDLMADGRTVLVHCHAGIERSPTVACAALVLHGWQMEDAYRRVVDARPRALPTDGQLGALSALAANLSQPR